jgi:malonyl-CoA/methylmalonyl-CoA synthetase
MTRAELPDLHGPGEQAVAAWARHVGAPVDASAVVGLLATGTVTGALADSVAKHPSRAALSVDGQAVRYDELEQRSASVAGGLARLGVARGDRVALWGSSSLDLVVAYLGVLRLGAVAVFVNPGYTTVEATHILRRSGAAALLADVRLAAAFADLRTPLPALRITAHLGEVSGVPREPAEIDGDTVALIAFTSGTTGTPRVVPLTHAHLLASIRGAMLAWRWSEDDVVTHSLPLFHQHGLSAVHATLVAGGRAVIHPHFDAQALADSIVAERATVLFAVPAIHERLVAAGITGDALRQLRLVTSGSAPLSPTLAERSAELFGQMPVERYGSTESGLNVSNLFDGPRRPGMVGLPLPGVEMRLVDEKGGMAAAGEQGEIVVRGPQLFAGYEHDAEATARAFLDGGWFRTGDLGRVDPSDGYLAITGRIKELIITGGLNVSPREVELVLEQQPGVLRAAVVGVPSNRWGEEVVAFVIARGDRAVDPEGLRSAAREQLAAYKCPKRVIICDAFPVNHMGKVRRDQLARMATGA